MDTDAGRLVHGRALTEIPITGPASPRGDDGVVLRSEQQPVDAVEVRVQPLRELVVTGEQLETLVGGYRRAIDALYRGEPGLREQETQVVRVHRPHMVGIDPERVGVGV